MPNKSTRDLMTITKGTCQITPHIDFFSGYRDAQVGWVEVIEDVHLERGQHQVATPRHAMFLVIYAPKRGILEVCIRTTSFLWLSFKVSTYN